MGTTARRRRGGPPARAATAVEGEQGPRIRQGPAPTPARDRRTRLVAVPLVLLVAVAFLPALDNGFVNWDDGRNFVMNGRYRGLGWAQLEWAWTTFLLGVYQPVAWMLLEGQYAIWGLDPCGYHLTSLVLHAANAVALYALTAELLVRCRPDPFLRSPWARALGAGMAAALFAVHPLRVEAVAWASCQPYLPCALFSILSALAYLRAVGGDGARPRRAWLATSLLLFAAAVLSKAPAVALPAVLLILDAYPLGRLGGPGRRTGPAMRATWLEKLPFVALGLLFTGLAVAAKAESRMIKPLEKDGVAGRIAQACYAAWFYLVKTAVPRDITAFYPRDERIDWSEPRFLLSIAATVTVSVGLFLLRRRRPGLLAAWLGYLVLLAPSSGLVRIGDHLAADRYSYLPMTVLVVPAAAGLGLVWASARRARPAAVAVVAVAVVTAMGLVPLTRAQCRIWRDPESLWTHALEHAGGSGTAHVNLGLALAERGAVVAAEAHYVEAIRSDPRLIEPHINLGAILAGRGDVVGALGHYAEVLRLDPDHAEANNNLAMVLAACPDPKYRDGRRAVAVATRACERSAWEEPGTLDTLAAAYAEAGDFVAAVRWQTRAIELLGDKPARDRYRSRLELYRAGKPYREAAPQGPPTGAGRPSG